MTPYPLLSQKYYIPSPAPGVLPRQRLWPDFQQKRIRLIAIIAPAGYGKSVFIGDWARYSGNRACWYSLHTSDNDLILFFSYFITSIRSLFPDFGHSLTKMLHISQPSIETVLALMIQQIIELEQSFHLILDDYHFIHNQQIHDNLAYLLRYLPENMTLIVISRTSPPWPLTKWRLASQCLEIGMQDLAFTREETTRLLKASIEDMSEELAETIFQQTEGWAAGIQLLLISCQQATYRQTTSLLQEFKPHVHNYLFEEVFHGLDVELQQFLLATAHLDQWNESLCEAVTLQPNSHYMIRRIVQSNVFIFSLDPEQTTYRYHHLFSDFLRNYLTIHQPESIRTYHARAGQWYEEHQQYAEAIEQEAAAGNEDRVLVLLLKLAPSMLKQGQAEPLIEQIRSLNFQHVCTLPELLLYYCWALVLRSQIEEAREIINNLEEQVMQQLDDNGKHPLIPELSLLQSHVFYLQFDFKNMLAYRMRAAEYSPFDSDIIKSVEFNPGYVRLTRSSLGDFGNFNTTRNMLAKILDYMGDTEKSKHEIQVERQIWGFICLLNSECLLEKQEFASSESFLQEAIHIGREMRMLSIYLPAVFNFLQMKMIIDPTYDREPMLHELSTLIQEYEGPQWQLALEAFRIHMDLRQGRMENVDTWLNRSKLLTDGALSLQREYEYIQLCRVWITKGRYPQAISLIDRLSIIAVNKKLHGAWVELNTIKAIAKYKQGRTDEAREVLLDVLLRGYELGYFMTFVLEGEALLPTLVEIVHTAQEPLLIAYARSIEDQIRKYATNDDSLGNQPAILQQLTNRELELVELMADGLTNKEIAEKMQLALGSVKVYSHRIYDKLHVSNRMQATLLFNKNVSFHSE